MPNPVAVAHEHAQIARKVFNDHINYVMNNKDEWNWPEVDLLAAIANDADRELEAARHDALNPCQHKNSSMTGSMWFSGGEVDDNFVTVCEDCGATLEGDA